MQKLMKHQSGVRLSPLAKQQDPRRTPIFLSDSDAACGHTVTGLKRSGLGMRLRSARILLVAAALILAAGFGLKQAAADEAGPTCAGTTFSDVCPGDWFFPYVSNLTTLNAISGYPDGTFRPNNQITRGQIMKVIVQALGIGGTPPAAATFADVPTSNGFFAWVEIGAAHGVTGGYPCGGPGEPCDGQQRPYFRPNASVTRGQIAKMIVNGKGWTRYTPSSPTFRDVSTNSTYFGYVERVANYGVIAGYPCGGPGESCPGVYFRPSGTTTRAQGSKIIDVARTLTTPPPTSTAVPSSTPVPPPVGCVFLPADNIWHRNIAGLPVHANSANYMNTIGMSAVLHPDFAAGMWNGGPIGIPYLWVPGTQPRVPMTFTYANESDPGPYPIPANAPIQGGPNSTGDRHVIVVDQGTCTAYELFKAYPNADGSWRADAGAKWALNTNALRPNGWTSADAAGLPLLPGLVRYDEVEAGFINHAIRFTSGTINHSYVWPARHSDGGSSDPNAPPMGTRLRLKASTNISGYGTQARIVLQALKDYGMILADSGTSLDIGGIPDSRWNDNVLHTLEQLHGTDFEVVDESSLMVDPNSGQSR
jgi:S-layer family protein